MPEDQRRSSGVLIPIILIVGLGGSVALVWWWRARYGLPEGFEPMPVGTSMKVAQLVKQGDRLYLEGMDHLNKSDPRLTSDWAAENRKALEIFKQSRDAYVSAQDEYTEGRSPPSALLDRTREVLMRCHLCRKRTLTPDRR